MAFTGYSAHLREAVDGEGAGQFVDPRRVLTKACTPATISKKEAEQKERFISQHVSIFLQQSVRVSLKGECWCVQVFRLQISAAYFQLPIFSSVTSGLYGREGKRERGSTRETACFSIYYLDELTACKNKIFKR